MPSSPDSQTPIFLHFSIPDPQGIEEMPSSPDSQTAHFFEIADCYSPPPANTIDGLGHVFPILHPRPTGYRRDAVFS